MAAVGTRLVCYYIGGIVGVKLKGFNREYKNCYIESEDWNLQNKRQYT